MVGGAVAVAAEVVTMVTRGMTEVATITVATEGDTGGTTAGGGRTTSVAAIDTRIEAGMAVVVARGNGKTAALRRS